MSSWYRVIGFMVVAGVLNSCAAPMPNWKNEAATAVENLERNNAKTWFPQEFHNLMETYEHGEAILYVQKDEQSADRYYLFTLQKSVLLNAAIKREEQKKKEEERRRAAVEAARLAEERLMQQALEAEERLQQQEARKQQQEEPHATTRSNQVAPAKDNHQPRVTSYTVRRGETLPQIAARSEIYNDASLWTLLYRANRDQIRDPKQLWPGQVLSIPRGGGEKK